MRLHLIFIGKTGFPELERGIARYLDRLQHFVPTRIHVIKAGRIGPKAAPEAVMLHEANRVLALLQDGDFLVAWNPGGKEHDSLEFAKFLGGLQRRGVGDVWMVLGGPLGISGKLLDRADSVLSLSRMTFAHDLARLVVMEQLYRAFTILRGSPYHK